MRVLFERHRRPPQRDRVSSGPGSIGGSVSNVAVKVSACPSSSDDVLHVGRVDRLEAALAQRLVDRAGNQIVRDVVENLLAETLLDERRRDLALPEARNAGLPAVAARDAIDLRIDDVARNFDGDAFLVSLRSANSVFTWVPALSFAVYL